MDKYEYHIKTEKMKKLVEAEDYQAAVKIADMIDWHKEQNLRMLAMAASVYEEVGRYQDAKDILMLSYERAPIGRRLLYKLTEISVKERNFKDAAMFYKEYMEVAPNDLGKYILRYRIAAGRGEPLEDQIAMLEAYKEREFDERWAYELAKLYHKAGRGEDCVRLCDEIILWFSFGPNVEKAMELKTIYEPLTPSQMEKAAQPEKYEEKMRQVAEELEGKYEPLPAEEALDLGQEARDIPLEAAAEELETETLLAEAVSEALAEGEAEAVPEDDSEEEPAEEPALDLDGEPAQLTMVFENGAPTLQEEEMEPVLAGENAEEPAPETEAEEEVEEEEITVEEPASAVTVKVLDCTTEEEGLRAAASYLKESRAAAGLEGGKAARVQAEKLNRIGLITSLEKLGGADLVITHAAALSDDILAELETIQQERKESMFIVLFDDADGKRALEQRFLDRMEAQLTEVLERMEPTEDQPDLAESVEAVLAAELETAVQEDAPVQNLEAELLQFLAWVEQYTEEIECTMENGALETVRKYAEACQARQIPLTEQMAIDMMEHAADEAEKSKLRLFEKKYDKKGYLILKAQHFLEEGL